MSVVFLHPVSAVDHEHVNNLVALSPTLIVGDAKCGTDIVLSEIIVNVREIVAKGLVFARFTNVIRVDPSRGDGGSFAKVAQNVGVKASRPLERNVVGIIACSDERLEKGASAG